MIRFTIQRRVFVAVFVLAAVLVISLLLMFFMPLRKDFNRYAAVSDLNRVDWLAERLQQDYGREGSWDFLRHDPDAWRQETRRPGPIDRAGAPGFNDLPPRLPPPPLADDGVRARGPMVDPRNIHPRLGLVDEDGHFVAGNRGADGPTVSRSLSWQGREIGRLTLLVPATPQEEEAGAFLASQVEHLLVAGALVLVVSLMAAWWLARHFLFPLRQLADAARRIAGGQLSTRVTDSRSDELGELAADFNSMAAQLARQEESRRQWISDTSHELRTPIAVLRAEIEAMQDGVREADDKNLARLHQQVDRLGKLVGDLRQSLDPDQEAFAIAAVPLDPLAVLDDAVEGFRDRYAAAGIAIETIDIDAGRCRLRGDAGRLHQVFANLLENTLRYTAAGGRLRVTASISDDRLVICFDDTAPAPPADALPRLFDRFYRVESSRNRAHGGSGLGLAICKTIVTAHGGTMAAGLSELGGLAIGLALPLET